MEIEKNDITSADSAEEEIVFSTGKKDTPAQSNNEPEVSNNYGSEPQADSTVSFGSALTSAAEDEAEGVVFAETNNAGVKRHAAKQIKKKKKNKFFSVPVIIGSAALLCVAVGGIVFAIGYNSNSVPGLLNTDYQVSNSADNKLSKVSKTETTENGESAPSVIRTEEAQIKTINTSTIVFGDGVTVSGVDLSGKTLSDAYDAMQDRVLELRDKIRITVTCDGDDFYLTEDDFKFDTDLPEVLIQAYHFSRGELDTPTVFTNYNDGKTDFKVTSVINKDSIDGAVAKVSDEFDVKPVDAHVETFEPTKTEKFTYADGRDGYLIDQKIVKQNITDIVTGSTKTGAFKIETKKTPFSKTLADVKANTKLIASHCTTANNVWASNFNMELAIKTCNGYIVNPGETFSFNGMTGDTTNGSLGYVKSTAIVHGKYEQQYGGGICQASTTMYLAALKADMEVVERHGHQFASAYAERGLDATVDYGYLDMQFKNTRDYPIYIATYVYDYYGNGMDEIMVEIYGPLSTEFDEIVPVGWVTWAGSESYSAKGAKVYFKNGKEIKREYLPSSLYDYKYDNYNTAAYYMVSDPDFGPRDVYPTNSTPTIFSPGGCGSNSPVAYGTAEKVLEEAKNPPKPVVTSTVSKAESSQESVVTVSKIESAPESSEVSEESEESESTEVEE